MLAYARSNGTAAPASGLCRPLVTRAECQIRGPSFKTTRQQGLARQGAAVAASQPYVIQGPPTAEIANVRSPVRQCLNELCANGLCDIQRRYREGASALAVPPVPRGEADPGTVGTADWLLRFLVDPEPELDLVMTGAAAYAPLSA
jgi:hypothetical protein